jgi:hypothetical protein
VTAIAGQTEITGHHALDGAIFLDHVGSGEAGIDFNAHRFGLLAQPAAHIAQRDDVAAMIAHQRREEERRQADRTGRTEHFENVGLNGIVERRTLLGPVGDKLVERLGIDDGAGQDVCAHLGALFQHGDRQLLPGFIGELFQTDRGRQTGGAAPDDHHIVFHRFAFDRCVGHSSSHSFLIGFSTAPLAGLRSYLRIEYPSSVSGCPDQSYYVDVRVSHVQPRCHTRPARRKGPQGPDRVVGGSRDRARCSDPAAPACAGGRCGA